MKALVKHADEAGLRLEDVPEPTIGINDVLIRVERAGICGTDLHIWDWNGWAKETVATPLVIRHAGGRFVVVSEPNAYRRALAERMGATLVIDPTERDLHDVQKELGMVEGFDVGLEMSGNAAALHAMVDTMAHGGRIAMLGIPETEIAIDWHEVVFNMLTIRGIYGREMYETWYQMTVMLQSGRDVKPVITHRFPWNEFERAFAVAGSGESGKVLLEWDTSLG